MIGASSIDRVRASSTALANKEGARLCDSYLGNESSKPVSLLLIVASLGLGTRLVTR